MSLKKKYNILLIEDNPGDIRLTQESIKEFSIDQNLSVDLYIVMDGVKAIQFLKQSEGYEECPIPDIILLDLNLPHWDGREVLREVKKTKILKRIPIIVVSTSNAEQDIINSFDLHANAYINKPVDFDRFFDVISSIMTFWLLNVVLPTHD